MDGIPFKTEAHQERIYSKYLLEICKNRYASATARRHRLYSIDLSHCLGCSLVSLRRNRDEEAVASVMRSDLNLDIIRCNRLEMLFKQTGNGLTVLIWNQPHRNLGVSFGWKNSLCSLSGISAPYAVHIQTRTDSRTFHCGIAFLALNLTDIKEVHIFIQVERSPCKFCPVLLGKFHNIIIESLDRYSAILVDEG